MKPEIVLETIELAYEEPRKYGFLDKYFEQVGEALLNSNMEYVTITNVMHELEDDIDSRTVGHTLRAVEDIGAIDFWTENGNGTTYDVTEFDEQVYNEVLDGVSIADG